MRDPLTPLFTHRCLTGPPAGRCYHIVTAPWPLVLSSNLVGEHGVDSNSTRQPTSVFNSDSRPDGKSPAPPSASRLPAHRTRGRRSREKKIRRRKEVQNSPMFAPVPSTARCGGQQCGLRARTKEPNLEVLFPPVLPTPRPLPPSGTDHEENQACLDVKHSRNPTGNAALRCRTTCSQSRNDHPPCVGYRETTFHPLSRQPRSAESG